MGEVVSNTKVYGLENTIKVCKYPMAVDTSKVNNDDKRLRALAKCDSSEGHDNALCGIVVQFDLTFTIKAWTEFERYHFADIISSQSTMHRITKFNLDKAFIKYTDPRIIEMLKDMVDMYNNVDEWWGTENIRLMYNQVWDDVESMTKEEWKKYQYLCILYSCPTGLKLTAGITTNYRQLKTIYKQRLTHRLPEWRDFCRWVEKLPYSELITGDYKE